MTSSVPVEASSAQQHKRFQSNATNQRATREARRNAARQRLLVLTRLMDSAIQLPGIRKGVGLDAVMGLVPVLGDAASTLIGLYLVFEARELGASRWLQARMVGNLLADAAIGAVPLVGDIADVFFRAHQRNLRLLQRELGEPFIDSDVR